MAMFTFFLVYFFYVKALVAYYYLYDRNNYTDLATRCRLPFEGSMHKTDWRHRIVF